MACDNRPMLNVGPRVVLHCPVDNCPWELDATPRRDDAGQLLTARGQYNSVDDLVRATVRFNHEWQDRECRAHLQSHDVLDFARTIARLREETAAMKAGEKGRAG